MKKHPILLLHGWGVSSDKYTLFNSYFTKEGYFVYIPDLPGFGKKSSLKKPLSLDDYMLYVVDFIEKKKLSKLYLIGHSFGGRIAICLASKFPKKISKLVLTGTPGFTTSSKARITAFIFIAKIGKKIFSLPILSSFSYFARKGLYRLAGSYDYPNTRGPLKETFKSIVKTDLFPFMQKIKVETILIWGENDNIVPLSVAKKMQRSISGSKLIVLPQATHKLPYDKGELFIKSVKEVLND